MMLKGITEQVRKDLLEVTEVPLEIGAKHHRKKFGMKPRQD